MTKANPNLSELLDLDNDVDALSESAKLEFAIELSQRLEQQGMSYRRLAELISASPAYVSKVMRGDCNLTIESLVKLAYAAQGRIHLQIVDPEVSVALCAMRTFGIHLNEPARVGATSCTRFEVPDNRISAGDSLSAAWG